MLTEATSWHERRWNASFQAGFTFPHVGVGNAHAVANTAGGLYGTAYEIANAGILPVALEDYGETASAKAACLMGLDLRE